MGDCFAGTRNDIIILFSCKKAQDFQVNLINFSPRVRPAEV